ncbi:MAG: amylo-alpha-1,6-glucosidase [Bacteroidales bacterium]|nr:amylo-alpha-1,6-glucosidase [Bacteroidales bacterium]
MSYIKFDKTQLLNLEYSLKREVLRSNRAGSYAYTTIICCNTRKYHGLLACPVDTLDGGTHMFLSSLDETIIQHKSEFNLAIHKYPGVFDPKGHKYLRDFSIEPNLNLIYSVGGVVLKKELILITHEDRILIRYTLINAHSPTKIRFKPFLAFRSIHSLSKANLYANTKYIPVQNGIKIRLYDTYPFLYLQFSKKVDYVHVPTWYYNIEYPEERDRGYEYHEDLLVPGFFETNIKKGETIVFSAGLEQAKTRSLGILFDKEVKSRVVRDSFEKCLLNAAQQFIVRRKKETYIIAGYPWFGVWGRDTFISLPGLMFSLNDLKTYKDVLNTMIKKMKGPFFPNTCCGDYANYNSADTSLWFIWAVQQYAEYTKTHKQIWKEYGKVIKNILNSFRTGTDFNIKMHENGLLWQGMPGMALTWMDVIVNGIPVTPRYGFAVEINSLWYNAIMFALTCAKLSKDRKFIIDWIEIPTKIEENFIKTFYDENKGYLADVVTENNKDFSVRPNQIFAISLPYSPIKDVEIKKNIIEKVKKELLTPKGLRTLSPNHPDYKGRYCGNQVERDLAYHQGTVWPWLLGHFVEALFRIYKEEALPQAEELFYNFEEDMIVHGIGTISEIYDGDPPHKPDGAVSQAWSVSELLRIKLMIDYYKK